MKHLITFIFLLSLTFLIRHFFQTNDISGEYLFGLLKFNLHTNSSFIFGLFRDASYFIRIVVLSVSLGIISLISIYFYTYLSRDLSLIRWGLTIMLSGVFGNGVEKLFYNHVVDYASINFYPFNAYYFNLSDALQIAGLLIVIVEIFRKQEIIWFPNLRRQKVLIYKEIQLSIAIKILGIVFIGNLTQLVLAFALLFPRMQSGSDDLQVIFLLSFVVLNLLLIPIIGYFLLQELLKCIGPIYALERHLNNSALDGEPLKLRKSDYFGSLEISFNKFVARHFSKNS